MAGFVEWIKAFAVSLGGPGSVPHRVPRFVLSVVPRSQRPPDHLADDAAQGADGLLRADDHARVRRRLPGALRARAQGRRSVPPQALQPAVRRTRDGDVPALRPARDPRPLDPAAADALQDLRARGRRRQASGRSTSSSRSPSAAGSGTSARACWRSITATRRRTSCSRTRRPVALVVAAGGRSSAASAGSSGSAAASARRV